jgi:RHS repeat-associated protein
LRGNRLTQSGDNINLDLVNTSYSYDLENKLKTVTKGGTTTTMQYYADGYRAKKETSTGYTNYIYNLSGKLIAEAQNASTVTSNYVWGPDRALVKKVVGGSDYYYLYNGHGDVVQMVDRNGNVVNNYQYDEWGNILVSNETVSNLFKYAGEVYDQETGLYYLRARYYDPAMGRFINEDSYEGQVINPLTMNLYSYCHNNPLLFTDPSGHTPANLSNLVDDQNGTLSYNKKTKTYSVTIGEETNTYKVGTFGTYVKNGKVYVEKELFYSDFGINNT